MKNKRDLMGELDKSLLWTLIERIKSGSALPADYANAIKYLASNNFQNISADKNELAQLIQNLPTYDDEKE